LERALGKRIGDLAGEALEARELPAPSLAHRFTELAVEVTEKQKRLPAAPFLAHEDERRRGREELDGAERFHHLGFCQRQQPLAKRAVAHLVVVLQEIDEAG